MTKCELKENIERYKDLLPAHTKIEIRLSPDGKELIVVLDGSLDKRWGIADYITAKALFKDISTDCISKLQSVDDHMFTLYCATTKKTISASDTIYDLSRRTKIPHGSLYSALRKRDYIIYNKYFLRRGRDDVLDASDKLLYVYRNGILIGSAIGNENAFDLSTGIKKSLFMHMIYKDIVAEGEWSVTRKRPSDSFDTKGKSLAVVKYNKDFCTFKIFRNPKAALEDMGLSIDNRVNVSCRLFRDGKIEKPMRGYYWRYLMDVPDLAQKVNDGELSIEKI